MQTKIHNIYAIPTLDEVVLSVEEKYELSETIEEPFDEIDTSFIELEEKELENLLKNEPTRTVK